VSDCIIHQDAKSFSASMDAILKVNKIAHEKKVCIKNASMFGGSKRVDYYLPKVLTSGLYLFARFQGVNGSVDEKLPYLVGCINLLEKPSIIVVDGDYWDSQPRSLEWLWEQKGEKLIDIMSYDAFVYWAKTINQ